jgi:hypothetical protein
MRHMFQISKSLLFVSVDDKSQKKASCTELAFFFSR